MPTCKCDGENGWFACQIHRVRKPGILDDAERAAREWLAEHGVGAKIQGLDDALVNPGDVSELAALLRSRDEAVVAHIVAWLRTPELAWHMSRQPMTVADAIERGEWKP